MPENTVSIYINRRGEKLCPICEGSVEVDEDRIHCYHCKKDIAIFVAPESEFEDSTITWTPMKDSELEAAEKEIKEFANLLMKANSNQERAKSITGLAALLLAEVYQYRALVEGLHDVAESLVDLLDTGRSGHDSFYRDGDPSIISLAL